MLPLAMAGMHYLIIQQVYNGNNFQVIPTSREQEQPLKIFVCEFITGGGLYREPLPASLAREGALMRDALMRDLAELAGVAVIGSHDARLPAPQFAHQSVAIHEQGDVWSIWNQCVANADAVWPIAPETSGVLSRFTALAESHQKTLLGSNAHAVDIAGSKMATFKTLQSAGINAVPSYSTDDWPKDEAGAWVTKPDDGVGCDGTLYFATTANLADWLEQGVATQHIIQPYRSGVAASLSMLCKQGQAWLLSCNQQKITLQEGKFSYHGSVLNGMAEHSQAFEHLAQQIAAAIPGLAGYVGVDVLVHQGHIEVLEINPRLTTSYAGLHQAIGCNPAGLVLDLLYNDHFELPKISRHLVDIALDE